MANAVDGEKEPPRAAEAPQPQDLEPRGAADNVWQHVRHPHVADGLRLALEVKVARKRKDVGMEFGLRVRLPEHDRPPWGSV